MRISRLIALATCLSAVIATAACAEKQDPQSEQAYEGAFLYGSDGNIQNGFGAVFKENPGLLQGMKGTAPSVRIGQDFLARLYGVTPGLDDLIFAPETYDAVIITAIAAELAGSTDPKAIAAQINGVTIGADVCNTAQECLAHARAGRDPAYRGVTVRHGFTGVGEPSTASYGVFHFGPNNQLDTGKTEYLNTGNSKDATTEQPKAARGADAEGPLILGGLLPKTGGLSFAYDSMITAVKLALKDVNDAGGVLGEDVVWRDGNDYTDPVKALTTLAKHKADGVQVIIGASGSGISVKVLPEVIKAGMVMFSSSNTAEALTTIDDQGMYFRTAPSDILQARALADVMMRDGLRKIVIVARKDAYGDGLMNGVKKELAAAGVSPSSIRTFQYEVGEDGMASKAGEIGDIVGQVTAFQPDGVLVIGFEESAEVIKGLAQAGMKFRS